MNGRIETDRGAPARSLGVTGVGGVRPLVAEDIPAVAELHARAFGGGHRRASPALRGYLTDIFCRHPWVDTAFPSLVYEAAGGTLGGVLGVMRRPMSLAGRPLQAAVGHDFIVDPRSRSTLAAVELLRAFLAGPQDLSLADGNASSRKMWEALGGTTSLLYSFRWTRPLRPARSALSFLRKRGLPAAVAAAAGPWCSVLDAVAARIPGTPFHRSAPRASGAELAGGTELARLSARFGNRSLRPEYDERSLAWLLGVLGGTRPDGAFRKVVVSDAGGEAIGWYLYYLRPGGVSEVVQIVAARDAIGDVLEHLFFDAGRNGSIAVSGQLDPAFMEALSAGHCFFDNGGFWMLLQSKRPEVLEAVHRGDALLTRLDGEGWMRLAFSEIGI